MFDIARPQDALCARLGFHAGAHDIRGRPQQYQYHLRSVLQEVLFHALRFRASVARFAGAAVSKVHRGVDELVDVMADVQSSEYCGFAAVRGSVIVQGVPGE